MNYEVIFKVKVTELGIPRYDTKEWDVIPNTGDYVKVGDPLVDVKFIRYRKNERIEVGSHLILCDRNGYFLNPHEESGWKKDFKCYIYPSIEMLLSLHLNDYEIVKDPYSSQSQIKWDNWGHFCTDNYRRDDYCIVLNLNKERPCISFQHKKRLTIRKSDTFIFLFEDNSTLTLKVLENPHKCEWKFDLEIYLYLTESDIEQLCTKKWKSIKIEHFNGDPSIEVINQFPGRGEKYYDYPISGTIFQKYVEKYIQGLDESGVEWRDSSIRKPSQISENTTETSFEGVYVYLMIDTTNGFHKIGISNNPEYRERTLQSEKPSIEMICSKRFPTREIARAIESSLHSVYSTKNIRGEWFKLDDIDVIHLIETLK